MTFTVVWIEISFSCFVILEMSLCMFFKLSFWIENTFQELQHKLCVQSYFLLLCK